MKYLLLLIYSFFFIGCSYTNYHPIPPSSSQGRECVKICEIQEYECTLQENKRKSMCQKRYLRAKKAYFQCKNHNNNILHQINRYCKYSQNIKQCKKDQLYVYEKLNSFYNCIEPEAYNNCYINLGCKDRYKRCFINCGGDYYIEKKKIF